MHVTKDLRKVISFVLLHKLRIFRFSTNIYEQKSSVITNAKLQKLFDKHSNRIVLSLLIQIKQIVTCSFLINNYKISDKHFLDCKYMYGLWKCILWYQTEISEW